MREIIFDTETTGRDPETGDRIVEIACVEIVNLLPTGVTFHRYVNPERDVPEEVVRVHGLTGAFLADKPVFGAPHVVDELIAFFGADPIVAHNAEFDRKFLNAELRRLGRDIFMPHRFVDSLTIARAVFPGAANSLDALSRRFQLDRMGFDLAKRKGAGGHGALIDAKMLAEVYLQLKGGRERKVSFGDEDRTARRAADAPAPAIVARKPRPKPLNPLLTDAEADAHAIFIAEMGDAALWRK